MNPLSRWFRRATLDAKSQQRLAAWRAQPKANRALPFSDARYVVVDVESTGLDLTRDRLVAIGAVAICEGKIDLSDSFEIILRQEQVSSKDNILIHGIGGESQRGGLPQTQALLEFLDYLGKSPLVAFHVSFDATLIRHAFQTYLGVDFRQPWLDLAYVLPALKPEFARSHKSLDHWLGHFSIGNYARHNALADAFATAQLLLAALPMAQSRHISDYRGLQSLEKAQRWLSWAS